METDSLNKFVVLLIIATITMSGLSGLLFYQLNVVQAENSKLSDELIDVTNLLEEEQNSNLQLEEQVFELQNQTEQLEEEILGLENEISELENQLAEVEYQRDELEEKISKITNRIEITELSVFGFGSIVGWLHESQVNVTIKNLGINVIDIEPNVERPFILEIPLNAFLYECENK